MQRRRHILILTALFISCAVRLYAADAINLKVVTDRPDAMYKCGEQAVFLVSAQQNESPITSGEFDYTLSLDGGTQFSAGKGQLGAAPVEIKGTLDKPGILRCAAIYKGSDLIKLDKPIVQLCGAAFSPEKIEPTATLPQDFKAFWDQKKRDLAAIPPAPQLTEATQFSDDKITVYKISLSNIGGSHVYGWFGLPKVPGKYPGILTVPWAGVYPTPVGWAADWARRGYVAMGINAHDCEPDMPKEEYDKLNENSLKGYPFQGRDSRETYYFQRVFLSLVRSLDYITSRPEWDGKHLIVTGSSQGGALSLIAAGIDPRVTAIAANVPAMCDHTGRLYGRASGWPGVIPGNDEKVAQVSAYYDAVNFARDIKCPVLVGVGLIDTTCPATSVYSAFNVINSSKRIIPTPLMGHSTSKEYSDAAAEFIAQQAAR